MASHLLRSSRAASRSLNSRALFHSTPSRAALYLDANMVTFKQVVNTPDRVVLVDFYADWCGPCRQLSPVIEKLTNEPNVSGSGKALDLIKVDTESQEGQALGRQYNVTALPTVLAFKNGELLNGFRGALPEAKVKEFIESL